MNRFYFVSYDREVGSAVDVDELISEMERLSNEDPMCVEYHLKNGHIVEWLVYIGEHETAKKLKGVKNPSDAVKILKSTKTKSQMRGKRPSSGTANGPQKGTMARKDGTYKNKAK